jgi:hypothetical protein
MATEFVSFIASHVWRALILAIGLALFLIMFFRNSTGSESNLRVNPKKLLKTIGISVLITVAIYLILLILIFFLQQPVCNTNSDCLSKADSLMKRLYYFTPLILFVVFYIYWLKDFSKNMKALRAK